VRFAAADLTDRGRRGARRRRIRRSSRSRLDDDAPSTTTASTSSSRSSAAAATGSPSDHFVHRSELAPEAGPDGLRFRLSPALTAVFLPHRKAVLEAFLNLAP
jgi:hypothetical protein